MRGISGLDKWLTTEPQDDFTPYVEKTYEALPDQFYEVAYNERDDWEDSKFENGLLNRLCYTQPPQVAAKVIEWIYLRYYATLKSKNLLKSPKK